MASMMIQQLLWSFTYRPYITLFLMAFITLSWLEQGKRRTLIWLVTSYLVAWAAEWGSINYAVPFGWYAYRYEALTNDLLIFGVPFFDSLSFSFLSYVSFSFAQFFMSPLWLRGFDVQRVTSRRLRNSVSVLLVGSLLMVVIDWVVDPIALLGRHWFLGDIYHYPEPGIHFGVPLANYGGWFVVAMTTILLNQKIDGYLAVRERDRGALPERIHVPLKGLLAPLFWFGIVAFQLGVTAWLAFADEPTIDHERLKLQALTGAFLVAPILALAVAQVFKPANRVSGDELQSWLCDYPCRESWAALESGSSEQGQSGGLIDADRPTRNTGFPVLSRDL